MSAPRFLQIHTLHSYTAALLNRDDTGLAKRLSYGGVLRTRISSQCLKSHWRRNGNDPHSLHKIDGINASFRSRELVTKLIINRLKVRYPENIVDAIEPEIQKAVYGDKGADKKSRQSLLLGIPEINWLSAEAFRLVQEAFDENLTPEQAKEKAVTWAKNMKPNLKAMRENCDLPAGFVAALFGRMVTSDPSANIDAAIHVAHAFTVHAEEVEGDFFTAIDDLKEDYEDGGADTIQETEITSGLFYGYTVVDIEALINNCNGNTDLAAKIINNLIYLIAEVTPGAKLGSTAPYGRAEFMMIEAGDRQPRNMSMAYRNPVSNDIDEAVQAFRNHLHNLDQAYETGEARRHLAVNGAEFDTSEKVSLKVLSSWAASHIENFKKATTDA